MNTIIITDASGTILRSGSLANAADIELQQDAHGCSLVPGAFGRPGLDRWNGSAVEEIPVAPPTLAEGKGNLIDRLAARRWQIETGGVLAAGALIATDDRSKLLISDAARRAEADPEFATKWKAAEGWVQLDAPALIAIRDAVFAHVAACFAREAELADAIAAAATWPALAALSGSIESFWPQ